MSSKCIYCPTEGKLSDEHYLPKCFGKFRGYEMLKDRVCQSCNNGFSTIDAQVCRSGPEAIIRERFGVKGYKHHVRRSPFQIGSAGAKPIELKGTIPGDGTEVDLYVHRETQTVRRKRQVTFTTDIGDVIIPITDDMTEPEHLLAKLKRTAAATVTEARFICAEGEEEWMIHLLSHFKDNFIGEPKIAQAPAQELINVNAVARPNELFFRGLAKIGFHYFLKQMQRFHGSEDVFGEIRNFIKQGKHEDVYKFIGGWTNHLKIDDIQAKPSPAGYHHHLEAEANYYQLLCRLQFFIGLGVTLPIYTIYLGRNPSLIDYTQKCAHLFAYSDTYKQDGYDGEMIEIKPLALNEHST